MNPSGVQVASADPPAGAADARQLGRGPLWSGANIAP